MKVFIIPGAQFDGSYYLEEILLAFGICYGERMSSQDALRFANPSTDLLILPAGSNADGIDVFLQAGGNAIAIQPEDSVAVLAGLSREGKTTKPGRLRIVAAICPGARGEPLWTLGPQTFYKSQLPIEACAAGTLAYLFEPGALDSENPGIFQRLVGQGILTVFAYDPVACISLLRQGMPARANLTPPGKPVPRSIHLHEPSPPHDTAWRPTADLHAVIFCDVVKGLLSHYAPAPTLWHIPSGKPAVLVFSGDEDGSTQEANQQEMQELESHDGAMSLYVIQDGTSITRQLIKDYTERGHTVSVHPNLVPTCGQSPEEQLAKAESDVLLFKEKFGQPVRTIRNHCTMWPGYLDIPLLWERLGIGMDANCFATRFQQSPDWGPYVNVDAAVPLPFVREDGRLIDVYQQPTHINDDVQCHPTVGYSQKYTAQQFDWIMGRILEDATRFFHAPLCANFHPCNYVKFATEQGQALMRRARDFDMPIWSLDRWHNWWRARASWRMSTHGWDGRHLSFTLAGAPCEQLYITLPITAAEATLRTLSFNGEPVTFKQVERFQHAIAQAPLPHGVQEVHVVAEYS